MNYLDPRQNSCIRDGIGEHRRAACEILDAMPELAEAMVATGVSAKWARDLGWPTWLMDGTALPPSNPLPIKVPFRDDLTMCANLLDRVGARLLLESILSDEEGAVGFETMRLFTAAPSPAALLRFLVKAINIQNPFMRVTVAEDRHRFVVEFSALPNLGQLGPFFEHCAAAFFLRVMSSFQPRLVRMINGRADWPEIRLRDGNTDAVAALATFDQIDAASSSDPTTLSFAASVLIRTNPKQDADMWEQVYASLRRDWIGNDGLMSIGFVRLQIRHSLEKMRRAPSLPELSNDLAMSPRTISRKLASLGKTFQEVVAEEKIELARQKLQSGLSVDQVAKSLGYSTSSSFGRAFQKMSGMSPGTWRERAQESASAPQF